MAVGVLSKGRMRSKGFVDFEVDGFGGVCGYLMAMAGGFFLSN